MTRKKEAPVPAKTPKPRFSKARLVKHLWDRADSYEKTYRFDPENGTAQFRPTPGDTSLDALLLRVMAYGYYRCFQDMARDVEDGTTEKY